MEVGNTAGRDINSGCIKALKSKNRPNYPQVRWYGKDRENSQHFSVLQHIQESRTTVRARRKKHSETVGRTEGILQILWHQIYYFTIKEKKKSSKY